MHRQGSDHRAKIAHQAGDAFYMTSGHVPAAEAGTEFIQFSPRAQLARTLAVMRANAMRAMRGQRLPGYF